jgi:hypothetical protein
MNRRRRTNTGRRSRGLEPYFRLVGLVLVLLAMVLVFGVVVVDLVLVVSTAVGVIGAFVAAFPGVVAGAFAAL